ncbi:MAG: ribosome-associated translation inhibitor RaiA [bacterium]|nr:ribosome-associated translation inhibitor RaiA [bacterium]
MAERKRAEEMPVRVQGKHIAVTDALRAYAEQKLAKLPRYFDRVQDAQVVLSVARDSTRGRAQVVEVTVWCDGLVLRAEETSEDMYTSIDRAVDKLERQIEKFRSRIIEKRRLDESRRRRRAEQSAESALAAQGMESSSEPRIVRVKRFAMKPMTPEEAVLQMELLGHLFFVFRHAGTQNISVLYKRHDGDFGLIEPEV